MKKILFLLLLIPSVMMAQNPIVWNFASDNEGWRTYADNVDIALSNQDGKMHIAYVDGAGGAGYAPLNTPRIVLEGLSIDASEIDSFRMAYNANWPVPDGTPMPILLYFTVDAGISYSFFSIMPEADYISVNIREKDPQWGAALTGTITRIDIEIPHNSATNANNGDIWFGGSFIDIDYIELGKVADVIAPVLSDVSPGPVKVGGNISATSNEDATLYLVPEGTAKVLADIVAASLSSVTATASTPSHLSTGGVNPGNYIVYAVDAAENISEPSAVITVTPMIPIWTFDADLEGWKTYADNVDITLSQQDGKMKVTYVDGAGGAGYAPLNTPRIVLEGLSIDASTIDLFKMAYNANWPVPDGTPMPILLYFTVDGGVSYSFFNILPESDYISVNIREKDPKWGAALAGTITRIDIEIPHNSATNANNGDLWFNGSFIEIDSIALVPAPDEVAPALSDVTAGPVESGKSISVTTNEDATLYLVPEGTVKVLADIVAASLSSATATASTPSHLSTGGVNPGNYIIYAVDAAENVSEPSAVITVTPMIPIWTFDADLEGWKTYADNVDITLSQQDGKMKVTYVDGAGGAGYAPLNTPRIVLEGLSIDASTIDLFKMAYNANWPVPDGTPMPILLYFTVDGGVSYSFFNILPESDYISVSIREKDPKWGAALAGTITRIDIEIPHNSATNANNGDLWFNGSFIEIDSIALVPYVDETAPVLSAVTAGPILIGQNISVASDEDATVYLVPEGTAKINAAIIAAAVANADATANIAVNIATDGINAGNYVLYAIDAADNISEASATIVINAPDIIAPVLSAVKAGPVHIGDAITATSDEDAVVYLVPDGTLKVMADIIAAAVANANASAGVPVNLGTTGINPGSYIVYAIDAAENVSDPSAAILVEVVDGIPSNSINRLTVYPNPATDIITIRGNGLQRVSVFDITGKVVMNADNLFDGLLDISALDDGVYFVKAYFKTGDAQVCRFVKR